MIAHPAGPRHAEEVHHAGAPDRPRTAAEVLTLAPNVWPHNTVRGDDGVVSIAGVPVTDIAAEFGDEPDVRRVDAHVRAVMQHALVELARRRRLPVLG